jgi:DNA repair exonuclease SbcCD nuclease subunit
MRFIHAADIHLGYQQYGSQDRYFDFRDAFTRLVDDAVARRVEALIIAGDLFHKRSLEPETLLQAFSNLQVLRDEHIPVILVEGNHECAPVLGERSWVHYLSETGLAICLSPHLHDGQATLSPWDGQEGAYVDLADGVRVVGMRYLGASTPRAVEALATALAELPRARYTILVLHAGIEGILDNYSATLTHAQLAPLRPLVDYLALGHIHKPFMRDDWIYNPGSLETNSTDEAAWDERGYLLVETCIDAIPPHHVTPIRGARRAFARLSLAVDRYETPIALQEAFRAALVAQATPEQVAQRAVVEVRLTGILAFSPTDLDIALLRQLAEEVLSPICCQVKDLTTANEFEIRTDEQLSRRELEERVVRELIERDVRYRGQSQGWANLVLRLKQLATNDTPAEAIVTELRALAAGLEEGQPC